MKTLFKFFKFFLIFGSCLNLFGQTVYVESISKTRETTGQDGYTLDGFRMLDSRSKLLNPFNFGVNGIYPKNVVINDSYGTSGSLNQISTVPKEHVFFLGNFNRAVTNLIQFSTPEIDALYQWSLTGGKVILCAGNVLTNGPFVYNSIIFNQKWDISVILQSNNLIPNANGNATELFNGPFGQVFGLNQGAQMQSKFNILPSDVKVLATNFDNEPTLYIDCKTLDLIVPDVDVYTDLGTISIGNTIVNSQDRFLANTIVFMDKLQQLPQIVLNNNELSVASGYTNYEWFLDGISIPNSNFNEYQPTINGLYEVNVRFNGGCEKKASFSLNSLSVNQYENNKLLLNFYPNPASNKISIVNKTNSNNDLLANIYDILGSNVLNKTLHTNDSSELDLTALAKGVYTLKIQVDNITSSHKLIIN